MLCLQTLQLQKECNGINPEDMEYLFPKILISIANAQFKAIKNAPKSGAFFNMYFIEIIIGSLK